MYDADYMMQGAGKIGDAAESTLGDMKSAASRALGRNEGTEMSSVEPSLIYH